MNDVSETSENETPTAPYRTVAASVAYSCPMCTRRLEEHEVFVRDGRRTVPFAAYAALAVLWLVSLFAAGWRR